MMRRLVVTSCSVLLVPERGACRVETDQDILVEDGVIAWLGPAGSGPEAAGAEPVDGRGLLAVPGLVNAHTHGPMMVMRGAAEDVSVEAWFNERVWPMEVNLTPADIGLGAEQACAEMLLSGVTAFADRYFHAERIAEAVVRTGIRADVAPTYFSSQGRAALEESAGTAAALHGTGDGRVTASLGPYAPYTVEDADLVRVAELARDLGLRIHLHAAEHLEQTQSSLARRGITPITVLERTGVLDMA
ncbi:MULTISPECIES: amidohydrolase family protein [unclassified Streptomyces]|uniref:amidohydrolase family protein n=1 Tax=unclassified Streptomyces TaxID=2593676 RepID=UPI002E7A43C2|nr:MULTISPECIES: amidohydrolase family protein [unclassified Streptomyces]MEE1763403.1 amidohydrolase family protein [Streptomyces sp. SP18BB07]MEE1836814.1 amidohydrolase family protein [Streptomyces sp. SP17KL33]